MFPRRCAIIQIWRLLDLQVSQQYQRFRFILFNCQEKFQTLKREKCKKLRKIIPQLLLPLEKHFSKHIHNQIHPSRWVRHIEAFSLQLPVSETHIPIFVFPFFHSAASLRNRYDLKSQFKGSMNVRGDGTIFITVISLFKGCKIRKTLETLVNSA